MRVWIVGQSTGKPKGDWEFQGVFSSLERAVIACKDERYFVGPAELDEELPEASTAWEGAFYPLQKEIQSQ